MVKGNQEGVFVEFLVYPAAVAAIARSCSVQLFVCRRWLVLYCALNYFCVLTPRKVTVGSEVVRAPVYSPFAGPFNSFPSMLLDVHSNVRSVRLCLLLSGCKVLGLVYRQVVWLPGHAGSSPALLFIDKTHSAPVASSFVLKAISKRYTNSLDIHHHPNDKTSKIAFSADTSTSFITIIGIKLAIRPDHNHAIPK